MSKQMKPDEAVTSKSGYVSERGSFEINANPTINRPYSRDQATDEALATAADGFVHDAFAEKYGADEARKKIGELILATTPGASTTMLLSQDVPNGMTLVHVWFGPNFSLFRHSHPRLGDCLYYVIAGEINLGNRVLGRGSTFFVPNGQPYKYTAGPAGVELLEFRAGGGDSEAPVIKFEETTVQAVDKHIKIAYENDSLWEAPERMGDTTLLQAEIDARRKEAKPG